MRYYTAAIALRLDSAGLHLNLGVALDGFGRHEEANVAYRESLRITPFYAAPRCNLVNNLIRLGQEEEALRIAREATELWPQEPAFHMNLACALNRIGKIEEARAAYREAHRLHPNLAPMHTQIAKDLFQEGKHEESLEKFREVVRLDPSRASSHYNLGVMLDLLGRTDEAIEAYRACLQAEPSPSHVGALSNLNIILRDQGRPEEAVAACRDVLARNPDDISTFHTLAQSLSVCGHEEEAITTLRECIRLFPHPGNFLSYVTLSDKLAGSPNASAEDLSEAVDLARKAVEFDPQEELAWDALGIAQFRSAAWSASIEAFDSAERVVDTRKYGTVYTFRPQSWADRHLHRALAFGRLGQMEAAKAWFLVGESTFKTTHPEGSVNLLQEAAKLLDMDLAEPRSDQEVISAYRTTLALQPEGASRQNDLAWLLATTPDDACRQPEQAIQHALEAVRLMPHEFFCWGTLGVAHYRNGQWNEAIKALHRSVVLAWEGTASGEFFLAMAHWQRGDQDEARRWYRKAVTRMERSSKTGSDEELLRFRAEAELLLGIDHVTNNVNSGGEQD